MALLHKLVSQISEISSSELHQPKKVIFWGILLQNPQTGQSNFSHIVACTYYLDHRKGEEKVEGKETRNVESLLLRYTDEGLVLAVDGCCVWHRLLLRDHMVWIAVRDTYQKNHSPLLLWIVLRMNSSTAVQLSCCNLDFTQRGLSSFSFATAWLVSTSNSWIWNLE